MPETVFLQEVQLLGGEIHQLLRDRPLPPFTLGRLEHHKGGWVIYPWTSLVAEFGGALGLFLGISFMSLWEGIYLLKPCFKY